MKSLKLSCLAIVSLALVSATNAQTKTETFKVSGNCGMCKSKIEKAALDAGAKTASWDAENKSITVTFKNASSNTAKIQEKIAKVGYDNAGAKASNEAYNKLHGCCKYERSSSTNTAKSSCCADGEACSHHEGETDTHAAKAACCKDGKCAKEGHSGKDCCKPATKQQ